MKKNFLAFIIAIIFVTNTHSQEELLRVVVLKNGTKNAIASVSIKTGEIITLCLQGCHIPCQGEENWEDVHGKWVVPFKSPPSYSEFTNCIDITSQTPIDDTISITNPNSLIKILSIPLLIKPADSIGTIRIRILNELQGYKYGDTISIQAKFYNEYDSLITKDSCFDSVTYTMQSIFTDDILSELVVNGKICKFGQKISQCFHNGYDTIKIVLKDSTPLNAKTITVQSGTRMSSTTQFALSAKKYKYGEIKLSDDNWLVIHKGGLIQFKQKIVGAVSLKLMNVKGELVHQVKYAPSKNTIQQYSLPLSLPNGYYVLRISSKAGVLSYSCMMMRD
jgi:hypothetical protein